MFKGFVVPGFFKKPKSDAWLFAGLGNPGEEYARHRHNVGFMALELIAADYGFPPFKAKFQGRVAEGKIGGEKAVLLMPQTYMNNSGQSVSAAAKFYKIPPDRIVVVHDEIDLEPGKIRVKPGGGNAGHNGLRSIEDNLGTPDFRRVRLGVGRPVHGDAADYVLSNFSKADREWLEPLLEAVSKHAPLLFANESEFMSKVAMETQGKIDKL